ncbi:hypothetical protein D9756_011313 [Leucocoprinus leucothites]|uniref:Uncharacterized protein n=1 Tax=Leucocoprinus leucothites TaxID=201217 RepID=A0A8H5CM86_9AGAR|nr:hypothetical protein D9756_011313 [Leucoagaricus leucothites]
MSHQIVEYLSPSTGAVLEGSYRKTSGLRAIEGMISMATVFNSVLVELPVDYVTSVDSSIAQLKRPLGPLGTEKYRAELRSASPQQIGISLVNAARLLNDSWRFALSATNLDILDSARDKIISLFREHSIQVQVYANKLREYYQDTTHAPAINDIFRGMESFETLLKKLLPLVAISEPSSSVSQDAPFTSPNEPSIQDLEGTVWADADWADSVTEACKPAFYAFSIGASARKYWQRKPCKAKQQVKFINDSRESRIRFKKEKSGVEDDNNPSAASFGLFGRKSRKERRSDQLDWSF